MHVTVYLYWVALATEIEEMKDFESYFKETIMSSFLRVKIRQNKTKDNLEKIFVKFNGLDRPQ